MYTVPTPRTIDWAGCECMLQRCAYTSSKRNGCMQTWETDISARKWWTGLINECTCYGQTCNFLCKLQMRCPLVMTYKIAQRQTDVVEAQVMAYTGAWFTEHSHTVIEFCKWRRPLRLKRFILFNAATPITYSRLCPSVSECNFAMAKIYSKAMMTSTGERELQCFIGRSNK